MWNVVDPDLFENQVLANIYHGDWFHTALSDSFGRRDMPSLNTVRGD